MLRDLRRGDGPQFFDLMERGFPEESALLGNRPEEFEKVFRRVFRWDSRLILGFMQLIGRPIVRALVVEADGGVVATTLVTFPPVSAYVSNVVVHPAHRRRGYAKQMLEEARRTAKRAGRKYLALDVLETNTGARTLYASLGYRPLRSRSHLVRESTGRSDTAPSANPAVRAFRRSDVPALVDLLRRQTPPAVEEVLPTDAGRFVGSGFVTRFLASQDAAWVIDRGRGAEAHVAANVSATTEAAHLTAPTLSESVDAALADALVTTATAWCAARKAPRILSMVAADNPRGRAALEAAGFRNALALWTLYRPVD